MVIVRRTAALLPILRALTISGTSSSSFGRSCKRKSRQWLPVSRCDKTCGPTKQSLTIPAHTLMLNCCWCLGSYLSAITHKVNVSGPMLIRTFCFVLVCGTRAQSLSTPFSYTLYITYFSRIEPLSGYMIR
jgi:hypothetical protein